MTDEALIEELARAVASADRIQICSDASYAQSSYRKYVDAILPIIKREIKGRDIDTVVAYDCGNRAGQEDERKAVVKWLRESAAWHDKHDDGLSGFDRISQGQSEAADAIEAGEHRK